MGLSASQEIRLGIGAAALALLAILLFAFVPDPFFQRRVYATTFDNVDGLAPGMPVMFAGAKIGELRSFRLRDGGEGFDAKLALQRAWRPAGCTFVQVVASNPLTSPRVEVASPRAACDAALATAHCTPLQPPAKAQGGAALLGCRRRSDLFETAQAAVNDVASIAATARTMVAKLTRPGAPKGVDLDAVLAKSLATLDAVQGVTARLDAQMAPGKGDVALTLANARRTSDKAAALDIAKLQATLASTQATMADVQALVRDNRESVTSLVGDGRKLGDRSSALMEDLATSLTTTSTALQRTSANLDLLTERLAADPTFALRGRRYQDPPAPEHGR